MKKRPKPAPAKRAAPTGDDDRFAPVIQAFADERGVSSGKMFGSVGLKVNGKVFAMCVKGRLVAKLPKARVDELVASGGGEYFDPGHGRTMKEWVAVSGAPSPRVEWVELAREAHAFVKGVRP